MVSGKGDDKEGANVLNVKVWVAGAVLEYEPFCVAKKNGENCGYITACRGGAQMKIRRKILFWKQYEGDFRGGGG